MCVGVSHNVYMYDGVVRMIPCMIALLSAHARDLQGGGFVCVGPRMKALLSPLRVNSS
jgi:hypothetical protein